ncbi:MAG TPA: arginase family protein, partial [Gemmataceae bacterium]|nr:arginase family protein [Gemmataceae bacterium]
RTRSFTFEKLDDYQDWRKNAQKAIRQTWRKKDFLLWVSGNHLGVLPVYDEFARDPKDSLVVQFDAHLDIHHFADCTSELSHGNFLLHCSSPLPKILNLGNRDLLLPEDYVRKYYHTTYSAEALILDPEPALQHLRKDAGAAAKVFVDIDCDVFDPAFFPAVANPLPFGLSPHLLLQLLDAAWSDQVVGLALSEFDPGRDRNDQSLSTLVWFLEYLLVKRHERRSSKKPGPPIKADDQ